MSNYGKLIIFIVVLFLISTFIVLIDSSLNNVNKSMPEISDGVVQGDKYYNESVILVNNKNYGDSKLKAISAESNYNNSLNKLLYIRDNYYSDLNNIHKKYIGTAINELQLKLKATDELKQCINYFKNHYNYTGTSHAYQANDYMIHAVNYQNERDDIVHNNRKLFN